MKKTLSILLAVVLMFAMAIPVFAADVVVSEGTTGTGSASKDVTATRVDGEFENPATVYYVTVDWIVNSQLKYTVGSATYTWKPGETKYEETAGEIKWEGDATVNITVTNQSNAQITAKATWKQADTITKSECKYTGNDTVTVASAAEGTVLTGDGQELQGARKNETINATITVSEGSIAADNAAVGTVTLDISAAN